MSYLSAPPVAHYYPRVHRPAFSIIPPEQSEAFAATGTTFLIAIADLQQLLQFVEPATATFSTFGHRIRQQLLFACTEVEAGLAGVLRANNYPGPPRTSTADYVKLLGPLRLAEYRVRLMHYPLVRDFAPFEGWAPTAPTQSLAWYHAYNQTKHDRESHLASATLQHVIHAVGAMLIVAVAQFGTRYFDAGGPYFQDLLAFTFVPNLRLDDYTPPAGNEGWTPVPCPL
jgi:hypothetical protein